MNSVFPIVFRFLLSPKAGVLGLALTLLGCSTERDEGNVQNSQTHWLKACDDTSECGDLSCLCGVCTRACEQSNSCDGLSTEATCTDTSELGSCGTTAPAAVCVQGCDTDGDCGAGRSCDNGICSLDVATDAGDDDPPRGVQCGDYSTCDAEDPCDNGVNCIAFPECAAAICIDAEEACALTCPDSSDCTLQESYPERIACVGGDRVPATPGEPSGDDTDDDDTSTADDDSADDTSDDDSADDDTADDDSADDTADDDFGDDTSDGDDTADDDDCLANPVSSGEACDSIDSSCETEEQRCVCVDPSTLDGGISESLVWQCKDSGDPIPDGGVSSPPGVHCPDYPLCNQDGTGCSGSASCVDVPGCTLPLCIELEEACELTCPDPTSCSFDEPAVLVGPHCPGAVPAHGDQSPVDDADGGVSGVFFSCGASTCDSSTQFCTIMLPGIPESEPSYTCTALPDECRSAPDCECLGFSPGLGGPGICTQNAEGAITVTYAAP